MSRNSIHAVPLRMQTDDLPLGAGQTRAASPAPRPLRLRIEEKPGETMRAGGNLCGGRRHAHAEAVDTQTPQDHGAGRGGGRRRSRRRREEKGGGEREDEEDDEDDEEDVHVLGCCSAPTLIKFAWHVAFGVVDPALVHWFNCM